MSHSVTITRTTTTTSNTSYIVLNTGYLKSPPGLLKFFQLLLGIVCLGIFAHNYASNSGRYYFSANVELFFFLMVTTFMIGTFLILLSCILSLSTGSIISKTIYEVIYHFFAGILLVVAAILVIVDLSHVNSNSQNYKSYMAAGVICIINGILYLTSAFLAHRSYRGL